MNLQETISDLAQTKESVIITSPKLTAIISLFKVNRLRRVSIRSQKVRKY